MSVARTLRNRTVKGGEIVSRLLAAEGVSTVFGIIDGTYFGLYSTFGANGIDLVTPRHETSGVHMAGAFARLTGAWGCAWPATAPASPTRCPASRWRTPRATACS